MMFSSRIDHAQYPGDYAPLAYRELKFGDDPVVTSQINKDSNLIQNGNIDLTYDFVDNPVNGKHVTQNALDNLDYWGIPWKVGGPEFWNGWGP